jgi:hypothetical protein
LNKLGEALDGINSGRPPGALTRAIYAAAAKKNPAIAILNDSSYLNDLTSPVGMIAKAIMSNVFPINKNK